MIEQLPSMRSTLFSQPINDRIIRLYNNREEKFKRDFHIDSFLVFVRYIKYERPKLGSLTQLSMLKYIMEKDADPVRKLDTPRDQSAVQ